ncbi:uncharacterized protein HMPREF1541_03547 [Cyphellophora europaea CBS 101466]|uniref:Cytochrome b561 domain-containing protein n=1 Tax=Cyphellophora europaea (strain CBS 101466) TaxID=1220924 RepID=W2RYN0_CYPE1|nr:uncharacterized protein HMPREF1541_03547 [Cyphellophora europaea CBS 101466]ETN41611.1 hypothetical protein HMPREF1541_03547 [Cyphellophora europaea CBS 101466]
MDHDEDSSGSTHKLIHAHAALCASAVLAFWPIGVMLLRYWKEPSMAVRIHQWVQVAGFTVYVAGFVLGVILWTRLKTDLGSSPTLHGVLGVVITGLACVQLLLGWWHHKLWQRESAKRGNARWVKAPERTWVAWMHMSFGWFVILIGIANGGIGEQGSFLC